MKTTMKHDNGLTLLELKSESLPGILSLKELNDLSAATQNVFRGTPEHAVFYLDYGIRFAQWTPDGWQFHDGKPSLEYLQLARLFNEERELKIWRHDDGYAYRLRVDDLNKTGSEAIDARQYLWGTIADGKDAEEKDLPVGWTRLTEARGTELIVPLEVAHVDGVARPLAYIATRNYIGYFGDGQATYEDCRFVQLG